jgi:2-succinyl-5-enolpyruvyl-6-hydroxy-3-cyclohexene-1-carboxylate synthase
VHVNVPFDEPLYGRMEQPEADRGRLIAPVMTEAVHPARPRPLAHRPGERLPQE